MGRKTNFWKRKGIAHRKKCATAATSDQDLAAVDLPKNWHRVRSNKSVFTMLDITNVQQWSSCCEVFTESSYRRTRPGFFITGTGQ